MNYKLLKLSMVVAVLSAAVIGCGDDTTSEEHFASGKAHENSGDMNAAIIEYKNALKKDLNNVSARLALGEVYRAKGELPAARKELARAIERDETRRDAMIPYAAVLNDLGESKEVLALPLFASSLSSELIPQAYYLRGKSYIRLNNEIRARSEFVKCSEGGVESDYIQLCRATIAMLDDNLDLAAGMINKVVDKRPDMADALMLSGAIYSANRQYAQAVKVYKLHRQHHNKNAGMINLLLAEALVNNGQPDKANVEIDAILKINPLQPLANLLKARILFAEENFKLALLHASNTVKAIPSHGVANLIGGIAAFRESQFEESYRMLSKVEKNLAGNTLPIIMNVINNLRRGNIEHARSLLPGAGKLDDKNISLFMIAANEFTIAQDFKTALAILQEVEKITPDSSALKFAKGNIKLEMGDSSGLDELKQTLIDPQFSDKSMQIVSSLYLKSGRKGELLDIANMLKEKLPQNKNGWLLAGSLAADNKDFELAKKEFNYVLGLTEDKISAYIHLAKVAMIESQYQVAIEHIDSALAMEPQNVNLIMLKAKIIFGSTQDRTLAQEVVIKAYEQFPDNNALIVERALIHATKKDFKQGLLLLASISDKEKLSNKYWNSYGQMLIEDQRNGEALSVYQNWAKAKPTIPGPLLKQIALTERMRLFEQGLGIIALGQKNFGHIEEFHLLEVSFSVMAGKLKEARAKFNRLTIGDYAEGAFKLVKGELLVAEGKYQAGINELLPVYQESKKLRPLLPLANAYTQLEQEKLLIPLLEQHLESTPNDHLLKPILASAYTKAGESAKAQASYRRLIEQYPNNPALLNNLAWALYSNGEYTSALEYANKALSKADSNAQILDTHGMILLKLKQLSDAKVSLEKALTLRPKDFSINAHNAQLALLTGDKARAKRLINKVEAQTKAEKELFNTVSEEL